MSVVSPSSSVLGTIPVLDEKCLIEYQHAGVESLWIIVGDHTLDHWNIGNWGQIGVKPRNFNNVVVLAQYQAVCLSEATSVSMGVKFQEHDWFLLPSMLLFSN